MKQPSTYQEAGVNIDAGNEFVQTIKPLIKNTHRPEVISSLGGFASLFSLDKSKYKDPVLVSTTDGVGTKLKIALDYKKYRGLGQDLVGMCVNDLICVGAEPLFFLDYFATGKLDLNIGVEVIRGLTDCLKEINCALVGGETAEMPGMYASQDFDLAGFAVGIVDRSEIVDGSKISVGNKVIGIASSGFHSNGYSLVRKILADQQADLHKIYAPLNIALGEALLAPTTIYVNLIQSLKKQFNILGIAHITGGGLLENPPRVFPADCKAVIQKNSWTLPPLFKLFQEWGNIEESEMYRVFNCGIGLVIVVEAPQADAILQAIQSSGEKAFVLGEIVKRQGDEEAIEFI